MGYGKEQKGREAMSRKQRLDSSLPDCTAQYSEPDR